MPIRPENRDRYPADWPDISWRIRFSRARGRCECEGECGRGTHTGRCPNVHNGPAYGTGSTVVLTTAHLDHIPEHCDDANLRAMCQACHLHYDRDHHRQTAAATRRAAIEAAGQLALEGTVTDTRHRINGLIADYCTSTADHGPHAWPLTGEQRHCPGFPASLASEKAAAHRPMTLYVGSSECLERECEEYVTPDGDEDPGVERCSHITTEKVCAGCSVEGEDEWYSTTVPWPCPNAS